MTVKKPDKGETIEVKGDPRTRDDHRRLANEGPFDADRFGADANGEPVNAYGRTASQIQRETERVNPADQLAAAVEIEARQQAEGR